MKRIISILIISAAHFFATFWLLMKVIGKSMAFLDEAAVLTFFDKAEILTLEILVFPLRVVLHFFSTNTFVGLWGYVPMGLNSLLWGFMIYSLLSRTLQNRRKPAGGALTA